VGTPERQCGRKFDVEFFAGPGLSLPELIVTQRPVISWPATLSTVRLAARGFVVAATSSTTVQTWPASSRDTLELLTARELEAMLKIDIKTIYAYVQRGLIPYVKIQSNVRFPKHEILTWIQEQSHRPRAGVANGSTRH
jgi:predicted DNA-binding transcriptional regulator AlpA